MRFAITIVLALTFLTFLTANSASALTVNGSGAVTDWGVTPFTQPNGSSVSGDVYSFRQNNTAPINYPGGVGYVPSPGGSQGEVFDLEEMHIRRTGSVVKVLLVSSTSFTTTFGSSTFLKGDLLINTDGDSAWELGVVTQSANAGLTAGGLYNVTSVAGLQALPNSYAGTWVDTAIGGWAVSAGQLLGTIGLQTASYNYGGSENATSLIEYTFDLSPLGGSLPNTLGFQIAWGCGNDVIGGTVNFPPDQPPQTPAVPEPMTLTMAALGLAGMTWRLWKRPARA
jgi:hypothetical protein